MQKHALSLPPRLGTVLGDMKKMEAQSKIFVAGKRGMVGSAVIRRLEQLGFKNIVAPSSQELNLIDQKQTQDFFKLQKPDFVFLCAAKVGGIHANNTYPADFLYENLMMATNTIHAAAEHSTEKLLFLGSSCIYPKMCPQPIKEEYLLTGPLEPTNDAYALAKIAGLKLCEKYQKQYGKRFISAMPTNLYGVNDNFHPENSHVIPGMMRRFHEAKLRNDATVTMWGTGTPKREFLNVDDLAEALVMLMQKYEDSQTINVGVGEDLTIRELAEMMKDVVGFKGEIELDRTKPDGTPRKILDVSRIQAMGWKARVSLRQGLEETYKWALANKKF